MYSLHAFLFGCFRVQISPQTDITFTSTKEEQLFCYLLLNNQRPHTREYLAGRLWGETTTSNSKKYLRNALWHLRADLGHGDPNVGAAYLLTSNNRIQIHPDAQIWTDVATFDTAVTTLTRPCDAPSSADHMEQVAAAVKLYTTNFLEGWYQDWCLYERERLRLAYFRLVQRLMGYHETRQDYARALDYGLRLLGHEPAHEQTHRQVMRLYLKIGDRSSALRQYQRCQAMLEQELDTSPAPATRALYHQIRTATSPAPPSPRTHALPVYQRVIKQMAVLQQLLGELGRQMGTPTEKSDYAEEPRR